MKSLTRQQIKNLQPDNLIKLLNKHGVEKTAKICGVQKMTIYYRIKEYKIVKEWFYKFSTN